MFGPSISSAIITFPYLRYAKVGVFSRPSPWAWRGAKPDAGAGGGATRADRVHTRYAVDFVVTTVPLSLTNVSPASMRIGNTSVVLTLRGQGFDGGVFENLFFQGSVFAHNMKVLSPNAHPACRAGADPRGDAGLISDQGDQQHYAGVESGESGHNAIGSHAVPAARTGEMRRAVEGETKDLSRQKTTDRW